MRIKGVDHDHPPEGLEKAFQKSIEAYGRVITPSLVMAHRPDLFIATGRLNHAVAVSTVVDPRLKTLASLRTAQNVGCPF